jgi:hypothetical protein
MRMMSQGHLCISREASTEFAEGARSVGGVGASRFMRTLDAIFPEEIDHYADSGCSLFWLLHDSESRADQRLSHGFDNQGVDGAGALPALLCGLGSSQIDGPRTWPATKA